MLASPITARPISASGIAARGISAGQLSPMAAAILPLFQAGVQGTWFDLSDFSTMFQDAAGTTPVTALGQPVGKILDRSPRGNHATCPGATTSRPTIEARVNRLLATATLSTQSVTSMATAYKLFFKGTGSITLSGTHSYTLNGTGANDVVSYTFTPTAGTLTLTVSGSVTQAQLAFNTDPFRDVYQDVVTATDYTDIGSQRYLAFDGIDDWLETDAINMTGTDSVTAVSGVRKNADVARGMIFEFSASITTNTGSFLLDAAANGAQIAGAFWKAMSTGTALAVATNASVANNAAPQTAVLSMQADISSDSTQLRVNGTSAPAGTGDQGTGNYGNYKLYVGRRGGSSLPFNGRLYGLVIVGSSQSDAVITTLEKHMAMKTGVSF